MRIRGVTTVLYEFPLKRPVGDVQLPGGARRMAEAAVFLTTDEDLVGVSITRPAAQSIVHELAEELLGEDPRAVRELYERLRRRAFKVGVEGLTGSAIAALDCALWDLRAKANGRPLWRELGGSSNRVAVYASGLDMPLSLNELRQYYEGMARRYGIRAGKLKVGRDLERDLERLAVLRDALREGSSSPNPSLMIDANEFWSPKQAIGRIKQFEREFEMVWVEEPVRRDDHRGLARVSRAVRSAVATGENLHSVAQFMPLLLNESADVIQVSAETTGITLSLRIAELADSFGLPVAMVNGSGSLVAHVAAVLPNHLMMEVIDAGWEVVYESDHTLEDGAIVLGEAPGVGISFDEQRLADHAVERPSRDAIGALYRRSPDSGIAETGSLSTSESTSRVI
jgi:L-alanine-DL-glutamate epimerase-like enolase superfamily enzyme